MADVHSVIYMNKLRSCYNKCIKSYFGYHRSSGMTQALLQTGLPSFIQFYIVVHVHSVACDVQPEFIGAIFICPIAIA